MSLQITLPDHLADRLAHWAELLQQDVPEMVETALEAALPPLSAVETRVADLSDDDLLALTTVQMDEKHGQRLSELQYQQRETSLSASERQELLMLMQQYNLLWVRQSQAVALAVEKGLVPPISS